jgi:hypothetical protein
MGWRIALLVVWIAVLIGLVAISYDSGLPYAIGGAVVTIAVGALVDRWWAGAVPLLVTVVLLVGIFVVIGGCDGECGGDDGFLPIVVWFLLLFTLPATGALLLGVGARRLVRPGRRGSPRPAPRVP